MRSACVASGVNILRRRTASLWTRFLERIQQDAMLVLASLRTGEVLWRYDLRQLQRTTDEDIPWAFAIVDLALGDDALFVVTASGDRHIDRIALERHDGRMRWHQVESGFDTNVGHVDWPRLFVSARRLVWQHAEALEVFDVESGARLWREAFVNPPTVSPAVSADGTPHLVVSAPDLEAHIIDAATDRAMHERRVHGKVVWDTGEPVDDAQVGLLEHTVESDAEGRFELTARARGRAQLRVVAGERGSMVCPPGTFPYVRPWTSKVSFEGGTAQEVELEAVLEATCSPIW